MLSEATKHGAARHAQLLTADLLYLLVAQVDPARTAHTLEATAAAFDQR